ncbi:MAG: hypothetical protein QNJ73_02705 [Gammaproteobacteria bacterium]|nr:hypothetical protein [Gammaproteobacteria bacterium]
MQQPIKKVMILLLLLTVAACARPVSQAMSREYLDEATGTTVVHLPKALVFYHEEPALAVHARDYISLGPVQISQAGRREYLLWTWRWSTIDRGWETVETGEAMVLLLDGEPMELISSATPGLGHVPYAAPVNGGAMRVFALTRSQALRITQADHLQVQVGADRTGGIYNPWHATKPALSAFALTIYGNESVRIATARD